MWIIYHKKDRKVVGITPHGGIDPEKETALQVIVSGLVTADPVNQYDAIQVTDNEQAYAYINAYPESLVVREPSKGKVQLAIEPPKRFGLLLNCDAPDVHPVDGISEIAADGKSFTTITVQKTDERGEPQQGNKDNDQLYLRTDYGTLFSADGKAEITSIKLKKGQAAFRLVSEKARRVATVQVFNADGNLLNGAIRIEFI